MYSSFAFSIAWLSWMEWKSPEVKVESKPALCSFQLFSTRWALWSSNLLSSSSLLLSSHDNRSAVGETFRCSSLTDGVFYAWAPAKWNVRWEVRQALQPTKVNIAQNHLGGEKKPTSCKSDLSDWYLTTFKVSEWVRNILGAFFRWNIGEGHFGSSV